MVWLPRIFKGRWWRTGHREKCGALPDSEPYLRIIRFQGLRTVKKKRELFPGPPPASPRSLTLPSDPVSGCWDFNQLPFRWAERIAPLIQH